jgi:glycogen(starch) synthase
MADQENNINALLVEVAWEVCNQVGGIYTVIRSKAPTMTEKWDENYCLLGPYLHNKMPAEFEPAKEYDDEFGKAALKLREAGIEVYYGRWLVTGRPKVVLINFYSIYQKLVDIKFFYWEHHGISHTGYDPLLDQVMGFGFVVKEFFKALASPEVTVKPIVAHFHEWMVGSAIPDLRRENVHVNIVFTTHATLLGRYLAMNDAHFYDNLAFVDWESAAKNYNVEPQAKIERAAAHGAHVFTTVSEVTARECLVLLGRNPDLILPNGINIHRFVALHEFQNLHKDYKNKIHQFVMGHFFHNYSFDLDKTLYFFTSGRFEYRNKGFDVTIEALARLNYKMQCEGIDQTVVMFFITKQPCYSINSQALQSRAMLEEIRSACTAIEKQIGEKLFYAAAGAPEQQLPDLNSFVEEYWKLRLRRTLQSWKDENKPSVVTHDLVHGGSDEILNFLQTTNLLNNEYDKVKVVYHPDFISPSNPLFGMEYGQFVRGCHLGVFPSYYEPWGYTPLEAIASGVPAITSDLSGFGDYVVNTIPDHDARGIYVINRRTQNFHEAAEELANEMLTFVKLTRKERIKQRNIVENSSELFDWKVLGEYYNKAHELALERRVGVKKKKSV